MTNEEAIKAIKANYPSGGYEDLCKALDMAIKALEDSRWIPVTERLPEEDGDYLVTTSSFYGTTIFVTTRNFSDGEWTYDRAVTAWAELPKPFEEGADEVAI